MGCLLLRVLTEHELTLTGLGDHEMLGRWELRETFGLGLGLGLGLGSGLRSGLRFGPLRTSEDLWYGILAN